MKGGHQLQGHAVQETSHMQHHLAFRYRFSLLSFRGWIGYKSNRVAFFTV